jgi:uncharacterized protein YbjT (DUF2867 family)
MASSLPTVFVCSATGSQGGSLARQLRQLNWSVHATVRDSESIAAKELVSAGVDITEGDWDNSEALKNSIAGCNKLFLCLYPNFADMECEYRQAQNILRIAKEAGVKQVVASTSLGVSQLDAEVHVTPGSFIEKHLRGKKSIEEAVAAEGFESYTFLRPAFFMANFLNPKNSRYPEVKDKGTWTTAMTPDTGFPVTDHEDIGRVTIAAFRDSEKFNGRAIGLASDLLNAQTTLDILSEAAGKPGSLKAIFLTEEEVEAHKTSNLLMYSGKVMRSVSQYVDMAELSSIVQLTSFKEFLEREREGVKETFQ